MLAVMENLEVENRIAGRVILVDTADRTLLFQGFDPQRPDQLQWFTPGGGLEPGETPREAAARELREETGLEVRPEDLGEAVFENYAEFAFNGKLLRQRNHFFTLRTEPFEISTDGFDAMEQHTHVAHRWWTVEALRETDETYFPEELAELVVGHRD